MQKTPAATIATSQWAIWPGTILLVATAASCSALAVDANSQGPAGPLIAYDKGRLLCLLANKKITESSGLAASQRTPGLFWTHNDSGSKPELHAFDLEGKNLGTWTIQGAVNRDWEDMASFTVKGRPWLLIADTGDNDRKRRTSRLYLVPEPRIDPNAPAPTGQVDVAMTIDFVYDDGSQDCEAVGVDPNSRTILLISKRGKRRVYELPLPEPEKAPDKPLIAKTIAKFNRGLVVGKIDLGWVVGMDVSPDGLRAVVATYLHATEYARAPDEAWSAAFARPGRRISVPGRRQGESICFGHDGKTIYLTSEGSPCPLLEVPLAPQKPPAAPGSTRPARLRESASDPAPSPESYHLDLPPPTP